MVRFSGKPARPSLAWRFWSQSILRSPSRNSKRGVAVKIAVSNNEHTDTDGGPASRPPTSATQTSTLHDCLLRIAPRKAFPIPQLKIPNRRLQRAVPFLRLYRKAAACSFTIRYRDAQAKSASREKRRGVVNLAAMGVLRSQRNVHLRTAQSHTGRAIAVRRSKSRWFLKDGSFGG